MHTQLINVELIGREKTKGNVNRPHPFVYE